MCAGHEVPPTKSQLAPLCPQQPYGDPGHRGPAVDVYHARRGKSSTRGGAARFEIVLIWIAVLGRRSVTRTALGAVTAAD